MPAAKDPNGAFYTEKPFATVTDTVAAIEAAVLQHIGTADRFDDMTLLGGARLDPGIPH